MKRKVQNAGDVGNDVYNGLATFGRFVAILGTILGILIGIVLIIFGIINVARPGARMNVIKAKVTSATCVNTTNSGTTCTLGVEYVVNNAKLNGTIQTTQGIYNVGQIIEILYDPANPANISQKQISRLSLGILLIVVGSFIILLCSLYYYLVLRFKILAAAVGTSTIISTVSNGVSQIIKETD